MKVELNWTPDPPTKVGKCLLAIRGSEDAIPRVLGESGVVWSGHHLQKNRAMKLKHHRFRFGLIGNLKVLLCRIFGHRVSDDPTGFACQRCRLAYEEIYSPGYWANMLEWFGSDDRDDDVNMDMPPLDGSEMIGEETVDEYLDRIVKGASPSWQGVDPQRFMDEVRGRNVGLEWKNGAPDMSGAYLIITRIMKASELYDEYNPDDEYWDVDEVLWHIGPFPLAPQNDEE